MRETEIKLSNDFEADQGKMKMDGDARITMTNASSTELKESLAISGMN